MNAVNVCKRDPENVVDPLTTTGIYRAVVRGEYGKRAGDKPVWWVVLYHVARAAVALVPQALLPHALARIFVREETRREERPSWRDGQRRPHQKPLWWSLLYRFAQTAVALLPYFLLGLLAHKCGFTLPQQQ
jgi:hypothetical protein